MKGPELCKEIGRDSPRNGALHATTVSGLTEGRSMVGVCERMRQSRKSLISSKSS